MIATRAHEDSSVSFLVSTSNGEGRIKWALKREGWFKSYLRDIVGVDLKRFTFVRQTSPGEVHSQVWFVPKGAKPPEMNQARWDLVLSPDAKAMVWFQTGSKYNFPICPELDLTESYVELLQANPSYRAHVVIATTSSVAFEKKKLEVAEKLKGIDSSRIRYFFEKYDDSPGYEFWIVPPRTKLDH